jgi:hypothetical protein
VKPQLLGLVAVALIVPTIALSGCASSSEPKPAPTPTAVAAKPAPTPAPDPKALLIEQVAADWERSDWPNAVTHLEALRKLDPKALDFADKLYVAHLSWGDSLFVGGNAKDAQAEFAKATREAADRPEAKARLEALRPAPTAAPAQPAPSPAPAKEPVPTASLVGTFQPRTLRLGDKEVISFEITNTSEVDIDGLHLNTSGPCDKVTITGVTPGGTWEKGAFGGTTFDWGMKVPPGQKRAFQIVVFPNEPGNQDFQFRLWDGQQNGVLKDSKGEMLIIGGTLSVTR